MRSISYGQGTFETNCQRPELRNKFNHFTHIHTHTQIGMCIHASSQITRTLQHAGLFRPLPTFVFLTPLPVHLKRCYLSVCHPTVPPSLPLPLSLLFPARPTGNSRDFQYSSLAPLLFRLICLVHSYLLSFVCIIQFISFRWNVFLM